MNEKSLLKLVLFLQTIILLFLVTGALFIKSQLLVLQLDLEETINNLTTSFQQITEILPGLNSAIDIVLSLESSLAILTSIKIGLEVLLTAIGG